MENVVISKRKSRGTRKKKSFGATTFNNPLDGKGVAHPLDSIAEDEESEMSRRLAPMNDEVGSVQSLDFYLENKAGSIANLDSILENGEEAVNSFVSKSKGELTDLSQRGVNKGFSGSLTSVYENETETKNTNSKYELQETNQCALDIIKALNDEYCMDTKS